MTRMKKEDEALALRLISELRKLRGIVDFLKPVDYVKLGLTDYPQIIRQPMDLGTVKKKIYRHEYTELKECLDDIQLIWENCRTYNMHDSLIVRNANRFERSVRTFLAENRPTRSGPEDNGFVSFEEQLELSEKVKQLDAEGLNTLVNLVSSHCPAAILSPTRERLRIRIDAIDFATYRQLKSLISHQ